MDAVLSAPVLKLPFTYAAARVVGVATAMEEIGATVAIVAAVAKEMQRQE